MNFTLNKELRGAIKLRYGWEFNDIPTVCVCRDLFEADHVINCMRGGYIIWRPNNIRDVEAEILQAVCTDVEIEQVLQEGTGEVLPRGTYRAPDARLDIRARASGREDTLRPLMLRYATLKLTHTRISPRSRFTSYKRMTKSAFTRLDFLR